MAAAAAAAFSARDLGTLKRLSDALLRRVAPNFPATAPVVKPKAELAEALVQYNLKVSQH